MKFEKLAQLRYSVRRFDQRPVEPKKLQLILRAGQLAPSAKNSQSWRVLVLQGRQALEALKGCTPCHYHAPLALLVCSSDAGCYLRENDGKPSGQIDAAIAATHMMLQACDLGIGSTWVMNFDAGKLRTAYKIPAQLEPMALLVCGYPSQDVAISPRHNQRKPLEELCCYESFEETTADQ